MYSFMQTCKQCCTILGNGDFLLLLLLSYLSAKQTWKSWCCSSVRLSVCSNVENDRMMGTLDDRMTWWLDDLMTGWPDDQLTRWPDDQMTVWHDDRKLRRQLTVWYIYYLCCVPGRWASGPVCRANSALGRPRAGCWWWRGCRAGALSSRRDSGNTYRWASLRNTPNSFRWNALQRPAHLGELIPPKSPKLASANFSHKMSSCAKMFVHRI